MLKRCISLMLVVLMLMTSLIACGKDDGDGSETDGQGGSVTTVTPDGTNYDIGDDLGTRDYGGKEITIGHCGHSQYVDEISQDRLTGDVIQDAIYKRNVTVNERLNVVLKNETFGGAWGAVDKVRNDAQAGLNSFQIVYSPMYITANLNKEGLYYDLNKCVDINLEKPYWGEYINDAIEIGGIQLNATGALCLNFYEYVHTTLVNTRILNEKMGGDIPDLFEVVAAGDWTLEYQTQLARDYYQDKGEQGKDDIDDIAGFYGVPGGVFTDSWLSACDVTLIMKDTVGYLAINANLERMSRAADAVSALYNCEGAVMRSTINSDVHPSEVFAEGKALMTTLALYDVRHRFADIVDKYIILPMPKLDKEQDRYQSYLHDGATTVAIPITVNEDDVQIMGATLECLASEGYRQVTPVYYETVLKMRYTSDPRNLKVLDDIMSSIVMDPITPYGYSLKVGGVAPISRWRDVIQASVVDSANVFGSTFSAEYLVQLNSMLNEKNGLNSSFKAMNAGE